MSHRATAHALQPGVVQNVMKLLALVPVCMVPVWEELNVIVTMDGMVQAVDKQYVFHPVRMEEDVCCLAFVFVVMGLMATVVSVEGVINPGGRSKYKQNSYTSDSDMTH